MSLFSILTVQQYSPPVHPSYNSTLEAIAWPLTQHNGGGVSALFSPFRQSLTVTTSPSPTDPLQNLQSGTFIYA